MLDIKYKGDNPVFKRIHTNLAKIEWICEHKRPYSEKEEQKDTKADILDFMENMMKKGNPFEGGL